MAISGNETWLGHIPYLPPAWLFNTLHLGVPVTVMTSVYVLAGRYNATSNASYRTWHETLRPLLENILEKIEAGDSIDASSLADLETTIATAQSLAAENLHFVKSLLWTWFAAAALILVLSTVFGTLLLIRVQKHAKALVSLHDFEDRTVELSQLKTVRKTLQAGIPILIIETACYTGLFLFLPIIGLAHPDAKGLLTFLVIFQYAYIL